MSQQRKVCSLPDAPERIALLKQTGAVKQPPVLIVKHSSLQRPSFPRIVEKMIEKGVDVSVPKRTYVTSLRRAIVRAGYFCWTHHTGEANWLVRLSKTPTKGTANPLANKRERSYKTQYDRWKKSVSELARTGTIWLRTKDEAYLCATSVRYHLHKNKGFSPFSLRTARLDRKYQITLKWKEPPKKLPEF